MKTWLMLITLVVPSATVAQTALARTKRIALTCTAQRNISPDLNDVTAIECRGIRGFFVSSQLYRAIRTKELSHDNLEKQVTLYAGQVKNLRLAIGAKTRSASISESKAAFFRDAYEAEAAAHQEANDDIRSTNSLSVQPILWVLVGAGAVVLGGWALGQAN